MLPTLGFICCSYGIYALIRAWTRRYRRRFHPCRQWQRRRRITMVGGAGVGAGVIILIFILGLPSPYHQLTTSSIIPASWGDDAWKSGQVMPRQEILPVKNQAAAGLPAYAYLHPETPPDQLLAEKNAAGAALGKKTGLRKPVTRSSTPKAKAKVHKTKKPKVVAKHRPKTTKSKKKTNSSLKKMTAQSR